MKTMKIMLLLLAFLGALVTMSNNELLAYDQWLDWADDQGGQIRLMFDSSSVYSYDGQTYFSAYTCGTLPCITIISDPQGIYASYIIPNGNAAYGFSGNSSSVDFQSGFTMNADSSWYNWDDNTWNYSYFSFDMGPMDGRGGLGVMSYSFSGGRSGGGGASGTYDTSPSFGSPEPITCVSMGIVAGVLAFSRRRKGLKKM